MTKKTAATHRTIRLGDRVNWERCLPATALGGVLVFHIEHQRIEILDDRAAIHFASAGEFFQRVRPRL